MAARHLHSALLSPARCVGAFGIAARDVHVRARTIRVSPGPHATRPTRAACARAPSGDAAAAPDFDADIQQGTRAVVRVGSRTRSTALGSRRCIAAPTARRTRPTHTCAPRRPAFPRCTQVPYFTKQRRSASPLSLDALSDWSRGNGILQLVGGGLFLGIIESFLPRQVTEELDTTPWRPLAFLRNFAVFRVIVDLVFYLGHRALHTNPWLYKNVHRRHHEHYKTNLRTNYHFTAPDLFIESAMPIIAAVCFLRSFLGVKMGRYEIHMMMTFVAWHESGTHLGKPLPVISVFPPTDFRTSVPIFVPVTSCRLLYQATPLWSVIFSTSPDAIASSSSSLPPAAFLAYV